MTFKTLFTAVALSTALMASSAFAEDVTVANPWARASAGMAKAGGAFMTLTNPAHHDHTLVAVSSDIATRAELHTHTMVDGVMQMRQVEGGILVPAGGTTMLAPGGYHVMFMGLHAPLKEGTSFPLTLTFDGGQTTTVEVQVLSVSSMGVMGHSGDMGKAMGDMPQGDMPQGH